MKPNRRGYPGDFVRVQPGTVSINQNSAIKGQQALT